MTVTLSTARLPSSGFMRPLNLYSDLPAVADLIELCFSATLDEDGKSYIDQMRRNGNDRGFLNWAPLVVESVSLPLSGFVWVVDGNVVGNVSLIPFVKNGRKNMLIANVATHPDFRRRGIARSLTVSALNRAREKRADSVWLHVREDNPEAIQLYQELGFVEKTRRTLWDFPQPGKGVNKPSDLRILPLRRGDWKFEQEWLERAYPFWIDWYYQVSWKILRPGFINAIYCMITDAHISQQAVYGGGKMLAAAGVQRGSMQSHHLWLAIPPKPKKEALLALLASITASFKGHPSLSVEYPSGELDEVFLEAGMIPQKKLVWMQAAGW